MKLRIRSSETKETLRLEAPDSCSLSDLKSLISAKLSTSSSSLVGPQSIRLSLNRKDELVSDSPGDSLHSLGITSGDLIFFSLTTSPALDASLEVVPATLDSIPLTEMPNSKEKTQDAVALSLRDMKESVNTTKPIEEIDEKAITETLGSTSAPELHDFQEGANQVLCGDGMDVDMEPLVVENSPSVPCFLKRVLESEKGQAKSSLGLVVVAVHAVFLESGFAVSDGYGLKLPERWELAAGMVSIRYIVPEILGSDVEKDVKVAVLKFSLVGYHLSIYGFSTGDKSDIYRVCLDVSKVLPLFNSSTDTMSEAEEKEVFKFWKVIKDGLTLPLLIDLCDKNGLPPPPCFSRLPIDLKMKILELLPGVDVARAACTNSELGYLATDDELWKKKFLEEFNLVDDKRVVASRWKDKFAKLWVKKKNANRNERRMFAGPNIFGPRFIPFRPHRFPIIGGDYDLFPSGGFGPAFGPRTGFLPPGRRNNSPRCDLGGGDADFSL